MLLSLTATLLLGNVTVTLPPQAEVRGTELALGSFARVEGDDPAEVERVSSLTLGYSPAPGYSRLFVGWRLRQMLSDQAPGVEISMAGSEACRIHPATESVAGRAIEAAAKTEIESHLSSLDASAMLVQPVADVRVPAGSGAPSLRSMVARDSVRSGDVSVPVRIMIDGGVYRTVWTRWRVEVWDRYAVLRRPVQAGETITRELIERRRIEASMAGARPGVRILDENLMVGAIAARNLPGGRPLTETDVVRPVLVKRGDSLFLEVKKGLINARVAAVAEQDGSRGDRVRVTLSGSGREMEGTIVSRELVLIDLTSPK